VLHTDQIWHDTFHRCTKPSSNKSRQARGSYVTTSDFPIYPDSRWSRFASQKIYTLGPYNQGLSSICQTSRCFFFPPTHPSLFFVSGWHIGGIDIQEWIRWKDQQRFILVSWKVRIQSIEGRPALLCRPFKLVYLPPEVCAEIDDTVPISVHSSGDKGEQPFWLWFFMLLESMLDRMTLRRVTYKQEHGIHRSYYYYAYTVPPLRRSYRATYRVERWDFLTIDALQVPSSVGRIWLAVHAIWI
jgi:hypothetical protein